MLTKRALAALLLLLAAACAKPPVSDEVMIEPSKDGDTVYVTAETSFALDPPNELMKRRVESARTAAISGTDPWSIRFSRLTPLQEHFAIDKDHGDLERVTRAVRVKTDDLQQVFSDANITVDIIRGDTSTELRFYPGTTGRASRDQQRQFDAELAAWSNDVARYFTSVHALYTYLGAAPQRAPYVFAALLDEKNVDGSDAMVLEEEQPLVQGVVDAMEAIGEKMDQQEGRAATFAEEADLVFNPFPARMIVRAPRDISDAEGFTKQSGTEVSIEPVDLFATIAAMEGKWISPDPLAALLQDRKPLSSEIARQERKSTAVVTASEVARALHEQLSRPKTYVVRWRNF